jgi:excisionase family DNA binding protein
MTMLAQSENAALLSPLDVARRLGISRATAYRLLADGDLPAVRVRGQYRVEREELERFLEEHRCGGDAA